MVNQKLHEKHRRIDFESLKLHEEKIKNLIKAEKLKNDEASKQILLESLDTKKIPPMLNVYQQ